MNSNPFPKKKRYLRRILHLLLLFAATLFFLPVAATILLSFWADGSISLCHYRELLLDCFTFYSMFWNSVGYALIITLLQLVIIIPAAFSFTVARFRCKGILFFVYLVLMMMPLQVMLLPNYIELRDFGMLWTRTGIIVPMIFSPLGVVVLHQYMKNIDLSLIEATRLETNSVIYIILVSVIPQIKVCLGAVALFVFAECYNMFEQPMFFLRNSNLQTLPVFFTKTEEYGETVMRPASVIFMIPILLLYLFFHRELERGLKFND